MAKKNEKTLTTQKWFKKSRRKKFTAAELVVESLKQAGIIKAELQKIADWLRYGLEHGGGAGYGSQMPRRISGGNETGFNYAEYNKSGPVTTPDGSISPRPMDNRLIRIAKRAFDAIDDFRHSGQGETTILHRECDEIAMELREALKENGVVVS